MRKCPRCGASWDGVRRACPDCRYVPVPARFIRLILLLAQTITAIQLAVLAVCAVILAVRLVTTSAYVAWPWENWLGLLLGVPLSAILLLALFVTFGHVRNRLTETG